MRPGQQRGQLGLLLAVGIAELPPWGVAASQGKHGKKRRQTEYPKTRRGTPTLPMPVQAPMLLAGAASLVLLPHIVGSKLPVWIGTMIMVTIDRENEALEFVNAGHNPGYVITGDRCEQLRSHGLPIGILGQTRYVTQTRPFPDGSTVVLYSDGITEAEDPAGRPFEERGLELVVERYASQEPAEIGIQVLKAAEAHAHRAREAGVESRAAAATRGCVTTCSDR